MSLQSCPGQQARSLQAWWQVSEAITYVRMNPNSQLWRMPDVLVVWAYTLNRQAAEKINKVVKQTSWGRQHSSSSEEWVSLQVQQRSRSFGAI